MSLSVWKYALPRKIAYLSSARKFLFSSSYISSSLLLISSLLFSLSYLLLDVLGLLVGASVVGCLYVLNGVLTWEQAKDAVKADVLLLIAAAFGLANALTNSGAANAIANSMLTLFEVAGSLGILMGLYLAVALMSAVISNSATVTLMYPIALGFATPETGLSQSACVYTLMLAGSACFATPIGYQTNLMVMGPGGYNTKDYLKFGLPLTLINMVVVCVIAWLYPWNDPDPQLEDIGVM